MPSTRNYAGSQAMMVCRRLGSCLLRLGWVAVVLVFLFPGFCRAEVYMYKDKDGTVHFTNNPAEIPQEFQAEAKRLQEKKGYEPTAQKSTETGAQDEPDQSGKDAEDQTEKAGAEASDKAEETAAKDESPGAEEDENVRAALEDLQARKATLDSERAQLEAEQDELMRKIQTYGMEWPVRRGNRELIDVSERLAKQQSERDALEAEWEAYVDPPKNSPDYKALKETKASLNMERRQIEEEQARLLQQGKSVRGSVSHRTYKNRTQNLLEQMTVFRSKRDAFEEEWAAFYSVP